MAAALLLTAVLATGIVASYGSIMRRVIVKHMNEAGAQYLQLKAGDIDAARNLNPEGLEGVVADKNLKLASALRQPYIW